MASTTPSVTTAAHPGAVLAALADPVRLRVHAVAVLAGDEGIDASGAGQAAGVDVRAAERALRRLAAAGLVDEAGAGRWRADDGALALASQAASRLVEPPDPASGAASPEQAAVLRAYLTGGRLRSIPAVRHKRLVVLDWLAQRFEPGTVYAERDVNRALDAVFHDYATLRRMLVDEDLMTRRDGFYWRSGGTFETDGGSGDADDVATGAGGADAAAGQGVGGGEAVGSGDV